MNIIIPGGMSAFQRMIRKKRLVIPRKGPFVAGGSSQSEPAEEGDAGDSLALFNEGGVTLLHLGML